MKKIFFFITVLMALLLAACTSEEQKTYEDALQKAKDQIIAEEFVEAQKLLTKAISTGYKESTEAQNLLEQLVQYQTLESLLNEGEFEKVYKTIETISQIENGSTVISSKAEEFNTITEKHQQQFNELQAKVEGSLKLIEAKNYEAANEQLKALDLTDYQGTFYESIKTDIREAIASNDNIIAEIKAEEQRIAEEKRRAEAERQAEEARQKAKAEAEAKANAEAARKNNMLNWSNGEIHQYIADYFNMNLNYVLVDVYNRTNSGYSIEARQDNAALGKGDPNVAPALGFFEVRGDGKLYKMDILSGDYILVN